MDKEIEIFLDKYGTICRLERFPVVGRVDVALILSGHDDSELWFKEKLEFEQFIERLIKAKDELWP
jgi:hypothetical protein